MCLTYTNMKLSGLILISTVCLAQTTVNLGRQGVNADFSNFSYTFPFKIGTTLPSTCTVGMSFFKTNATAGSNIYGCTATNTWTAQGGSGGSSPGAPDNSLQYRVNSTTLGGASGTSWNNAQGRLSQTPVAPTFLVSSSAVASTSTFQSPSQVAIQGKYAYIAANNGTLNVFDISNISAPVLVSTTTDAVNLDTASYLVVSGSYAYVGNLDADGNPEISIWDISNAHAPTLEGTFSSAAATEVTGLYIQGHYLYYTSDCCNGTSNGFYVVDVTDPANPVQVGSIVGDNTHFSVPYCLTVSGKYAYVGNYAQPNTTAVFTYFRDQRQYRRSNKPERRGFSSRCDPFHLD